MAFKREVVVQAPIERVFEVVSTYEYAPKMLYHIVKIDKVTEGPIGVGTEFVERRNIRRMNINNTLVVADYEKNKRFVMKSDQHKLSLEYTYTFEEAEEGTKINFVGKIRTRGLKNLLYKPMINNIIIKEDGHHLLAIKDYLEEGPLINPENEEELEKIGENK